MSQKWMSFFLLGSLTLSSVSPAFADPGRPGPFPGPGPHPGDGPRPGPAPDTSGARRDGYEDGVQAGRREGFRNGAEEGRRRGITEGEQAGFRRCSEDLARRNYDSGYSTGDRDGHYEGDRAGRTQGAYDGEARGLTDGRAAGIRRADRDADQNASPLGAARGREDADSSDAAQRGQVDGRVAGEREAREDAVATDYVRGHQAVREEMYREPVAAYDEFSQVTEETPVPDGGVSSERPVLHSAKRASALNLLQLDSELLSTLVELRRSFPSPEENAAYEEGYRSGYDDGYRQAFREGSDRAYREVYEAARDRGCDNARSRDYRPDYERGYREGRNHGYNQAYRSAYDVAFRSAYDVRYRDTENTTYNQNYADFYNRYFDSARANAYAERTGQLYQGAYQAARQQRYDELRASYGEQEYQRGRQEETQDFVNRPVRLLDAAILETNGNSLIEPSETLRIRLKLRNFSAVAIPANQVMLELNALDDNSVVISSHQLPLARGLQSKSVTTVTDAFDFQIKDSAVRKATRLQLRVMAVGQSAGEKVLEAQALYAVDVQLAESPVFQYGLETVLRFTLKNVSAAPTADSLRVRLDAVHPDLQFSMTELVTGALAPGETRLVEFPASTRTSDSAVAFALRASITGADERKIGELSQSQQIPVISNYRISMRNAADLRSKGGTKLKYSIQNLQKDKPSGKLLVRLTFRTEGGEAISVVGNNPLELIKINPGSNLLLTLPVRVNRTNSGGVVELELMENGKPLLFHRQTF